MKTVNGTLQFKGKEYKIVFNLNVMQTIQEEYGSIDAWGKLTDGTTNDGEPNVKAVIFGFREMLNEAIDIENEENGTDTPMMTLKQVGRLITEYGLQRAATKMNKTVIESTKSDEKNA